MILRVQKNLNLKSPFIWVFPKIMVPKMDGLEWKTLLTWMIWGYHYFWKHPYSSEMFCSIFHTPQKNQPKVFQGWMTIQRSHRNHGTGIFTYILSSKSTIHLGKRATSPPWIVWVWPRKSWDGLHSLPPWNMTKQQVELTHHFQGP